MKVKQLKQGEIYRYPQGAKVRIKETIACHEMYHNGGTLIYQDKVDIDDDEYRVGIHVNKGVCYCFHPDSYEIILDN